MGSTTETLACEPIALIGMSCKFPGDASTPEKFWNMLAEGRDAWSEIPLSRFNLRGVYHPNKEKLSTTNVRGAHFMDEDPGRFDAAFFNYSAETALAVDPGFRLQLESVYEALENAGLPLPQVAGSNTSVFTGVFVHDYKDSMQREDDNPPKFYNIGTGPAMSSNRISHFFDLRGASMTIDTGCSSTLVALHQSIQSLRLGEADMSIVGGSNLLLGPGNFKTMSSIGFLSPNGKSLAFDSRANGYGRGEGVATVVIKCLKDALAAGDPIRAIIRESLLNQDGKTETITSPSQERQESLIRDCYRKAGLDPLDTQYVELHGTGTQAGDSIEARAIAAVFKPGRRHDQLLRIGSVKTNIGHLEATSGLASLIKVVLALEKGLIPPSINFEKANPKLAFDEWRLKIATDLEPWPQTSDATKIRRASINSFGYGGSNSHVIVEVRDSYLPDMTESSVKMSDFNGVSTSAKTTGEMKFEMPSYKTKVIILSARDQKSCEKMVSNLRQYLKDKVVTEPDLNSFIFLQSLAYTLGERRTLFSWVATTVMPFSRGMDEAIQALDLPNFTPSYSSRKPRIGMIFTGQGAQWHAMGRELIVSYPIFRASLEEAERYLSELGADWLLLKELSRDAETSRVSQTAYSTPICIAVQISLVNMMRSWGIKPCGVASHSSGEIAAAYTVGAITYKQAMIIAYHRAVLVAHSGFRSTIKSGMVAVGLGKEETESYMASLNNEGKTVIACINSPSSTTVAGDIDAVIELEAKCKENGVFARCLKVDIGYHSHHMLPVAGPYRQKLEKMLEEEDKSEDNLDSIAFSSPVTGDRIIDADEIADPDHWVCSLVKPVQFVDAFTDMILGDNDPSGTSVDFIMEVGPHTALGGPIREILAQPAFKNVPHLPYFSCLVRNTNARDSMQILAANLLKAGYPLDMNAVNFPYCKWGYLRVLTDLPSYPWNHTNKFWVEHRLSKALQDKNRQPPHDLLGSLILGYDIDRPAWKNIIRTTELPWIRDHVVQGNILFPGASYVSLAIEAVKQLSEIEAEIEAESGVISSKAIVSYQLRDIDIIAALVVPDTSNGIEILTSLRPTSEKDIGVKGWKHFTVQSVSANNRWTLHCQGLILVNFKDTANALISPGKQRNESEMIDYIRNIEPADMWASLRAVGLCHGPIFQNIKGIVQSSTESRARAIIEITNTLVEPDLPRHPVVHPTTLDSIGISLFASLPRAGAEENNARVPRSIGKLWVSNKISHQSGHRFNAYSSLRRWDAQSLEGDVMVTDYNDENLVLQMENVRFQSLGQSVSHSLAKPWEKEICSKVEWAPDLSIASPAAFESIKGELSQASRPEETDSIVDLWQFRSLLRQVAHKHPRAHIIQISADFSVETLRHAVTTLDGMHFGGPLVASYHFTHNSLDSFEVAQKVLLPWSGLVNVAFDMLDTEKDLATQGFEFRTYDIVIVTGVEMSTNSMVNIRKLIKPNGFLLHIDRSTGKNSSNLDQTLKKTQFTGIDIELSGFQDKGSSTIRTIMSRALPSTKSQGSPNLNSKSILLVTSSQTCLLSPAWINSLKSSLAAESCLPFVQPVVVIDESECTKKDFEGKVCVYVGELNQPILHNMDARKLANINAMVTGCKGLIWLTRGGTVDCEIPKLSLAPGFLRVLRSEYIGRQLILLDFDAHAPLWSSSSAQALAQVLKVAFSDDSPVNSMFEFEYAERNGLLLIPRLYKDISSNKIIFPDPIDYGIQNALLTEPLFQPDRPLSLQVGSPGLLNSLAWGDDGWAVDHLKELPVDMIEIEPRAYGVNFRDFMVAMGQLEERVMGLDCAGVITRVGSEAATHGYSVGDNVFAFLHGPYASRARVWWHGVMHMPNGMSFEDAASIALVFLTAYIGLVDTARLHKGQSVLIHAAAGGVGQAAIMLARHLGAEIFATAGTPAKRQMLIQKYGIPKDHIFSSRNSSFSPAILSATDGRGVDVVLNSLAGPLLQESFNLLATFGHFVEIGKKELENNSNLEMRPFSRNVSISSLDLLSYLKYRGSDIHRALGNIMKLLKAKVISTIYPIVVFPMAEASKAFRLLQTGQHFGKIVLSVSQQEMVPILPRVKRAQLNPTASYLLVGGLGVIGRFIAHWMVAHGAKNIIFLSRSAGNLEKNGVFIAGLEKIGCRVKGVNCDVSDQSNLAAVLQACRDESLPPVRGVIQAAMVLQDSIFELMTISQWRSATLPKVAGTWNLHQQFSGIDSLDFFITLSSISGIVGVASQSNYAAGNSYEDAVMQWRVNHGLPGVSLNLDIVKGIGEIDKIEKIVSRLKDLGHFPLEESWVLKVLEIAILAPYSAQVVVGINNGPGKHWDHNGQAQMGRDARYAALESLEGGKAGHDKKHKRQDSNNIGSLARNLSKVGSYDDAVKLVADAIAQMLSSIFMLSVGDIELKTTLLTRYGVDSLVAVELRNALAMYAGAEVSIFVILQSLSVLALAKEVVAKSLHVNICRSESISE